MSMRQRLKEMEHKVSSLIESNNSSWKIINEMDSTLNRFKAILEGEPEVSNEKAALELGISKSYVSKMRSALGIQDQSMARNFGKCKEEKEIADVSNVQSIRLSRSLSLYSAIYRVSASCYRVTIAGKDQQAIKKIREMTHERCLNVQVAKYIFIAPADLFIHGMKLEKVLLRERSIRIEVKADFPFESMYCPVFFKKDNIGIFCIDYNERIDLERVSHV